MKKDSVYDFEKFDRVRVRRNSFHTNMPLFEGYFGDLFKAAVNNVFPRQAVGGEGRFPVIYGVSIKDYDPAYAKDYIVLADKEEWLYLIVPAEEWANMREGSTPRPVHVFIVSGDELRFVTPSSAQEIYECRLLYHRADEGCHLLARVVPTDEAPSLKVALNYAVPIEGGDADFGFAYLVYIKASSDEEATRKAFPIFFEKIKADLEAERKRFDEYVRVRENGCAYLFRRMHFPPLQAEQEETNNDVDDDEKDNYDFLIT